MFTSPFDAYEVVTRKDIVVHDKFKNYEYRKFSEIIPAGTLVCLRFSPVHQVLALYPDDIAGTGYEILINPSELDFDFVT